MKSDGTLYRPYKYREIARERYLISKHTHTSYEDVAEITPLERKYLIEFIVEDYEKIQELRDKLRQELL